MTTANIAKMLPGPLCLEAREWLLRQPDARTAWETCRRGDWLLYQLGHARGVDRKRLVFAACECARMALRYVPAGEHRPRLAIEAAEAWCRDEATTEHLKQAREAAYNAEDAAAAAAVSAATADATAVSAAAATVSAAAAAAAAATTAAAAAAAGARTVGMAVRAAAGAAAAAAAGSEGALVQCADIVRKHFTLTDLMD